MSSMFIPVVAHVRISSFIRANNILLYVYTTFSLSNYPSMDTWVASTFKRLWIMLLSKWVCKCLFEILLCILWIYIQKWNYIKWNHVIYIFWGTFIVPWKFLLDSPFYTPINRAHRFQFYHILPTLLIFCIFHGSLSNESEVESHCCFHMHFPND